jgi:hypothetical protein
MEGGRGTPAVALLLEQGTLERRHYHWSKGRLTRVCEIDTTGERGVVKHSFKRNRGVLMPFSTGNGGVSNVVVRFEFSGQHLCGSYFQTEPLRSQNIS